MKAPAGIYIIKLCTQKKILVSSSNCPEKKIEDRSCTPTTSSYTQADGEVAVNKSDAFQLRVLLTGAKLCADDRHAVWWFQPDGL